MVGYGLTSRGWGEENKRLVRFGNRVFQEKDLQRLDEKILVERLPLDLLEMQSYTGYYFLGLTLWKGVYLEVSEIPQPSKDDRIDLRNALGKLGLAPNTVMPELVFISLSWA